MKKMHLKLQGGKEKKTLARCFYIGGITKKLVPFSSF